MNTTRKSAFKIYNKHGVDILYATISLRVDPDVLDFFKGQGKGHLTRMNSVLRSYVKAQQAR